MLGDYLRIAFFMMRARPVRASLSLLGIYIGVLSLVIILSIREGIRHQLDDLYRTVDAQIVYVYPGYDAERKKVGRLRADDLEILRLTPGIQSVSPRVVYDWPLQSATASMSGRVLLADERLMHIYRIPLKSGRTFLPAEVQSRAAVCLLSETAASKLFPRTSGLGETIAFEGMMLQVIGIMDWTLQVSQRIGQSDVDVLIPPGVVPSTSRSPLSMVEVRLDPQIPGARAVAMVKSAVSRGDSQREALYFVRSLEQGVERSKQFNEKILAGLLGIAGISLLVGAIGIANVMITSVTERTREVGIRKALGARRIDILGQFIVESCTLCVAGGLAAVISGALVVKLAPLFMELSNPMVLPVASVSACLFLTVFIGILAGGYPASRAAALSPADALRYE